MWLGLDFGATPRLIDTCLEPAEQADLPVALHTDLMNESGSVRDTIGATHVAPCTPTYTVGELFPMTMTVHRQNHYVEGDVEISPAAFAVMPSPPRTPAPTSCLQCHAPVHGDV